MQESLFCVNCLRGDEPARVRACVIYEGRSLCISHFEDLAKRLAEAVINASGRNR